MNTAELLKKLKKLINSESFLLRHRINEKVFKRKRILPFNVTMATILNGVRASTTVELDKFSDYFETIEPTKSAFSQARHKIKYSAFVELNDTFIKEYYNSNVKIMPHKRNFFKDLRLVGIDGYNLQLPISSKIKNHFGCATNASNKKIPMASASQLYDIENGLTISSFVERYEIGERELALKLIKDFIAKGLEVKSFVFIFDRGYPSLMFLIYLDLLGIKFVMRCNRNFLSEVNNAVASGRKDQVIKLSLNKLNKSEREFLIAEFPRINFSDTIEIRVCLIKLETNETEILLTSMTSKNVFQYKLFKQLYSKRWGVETDIAFQKTRLQIENFSGESILAVQQEFYSSILWKNVTNLLILEAESDLFEVEPGYESELIHGEIDDIFLEEECAPTKQEDTHEIQLRTINNVVKKRAPKNFKKAINRSIAYSRMKNRFIKALFDPDVNMDNFCSTIKNLMKKNLEPVRPGRKFEHKTRYPGKKYHKNTRRIA